MRCVLTVHVYPVDDFMTHVLEGTGCSCEPRIEWLDPDTGLPYSNGPLVVHNALDRRELTEQYRESGEWKSKGWRVQD